MESRSSSLYDRPGRVVSVHCDVVPPQTGEPPQARRAQLATQVGAAKAVFLAASLKRRRLQLR
jgi:hypothetical protein